VLLLKDLKVQFCTKDEMCIGASEYSLPVICNDFPMNFNGEDYFKVSCTYHYYISLHIIYISLLFTTNKIMYYDIILLNVETNINTICLLIL